MSIKRSPFVSFVSLFVALAACGKQQAIQVDSVSKSKLDSGDAASKLPATETVPRSENTATTQLPKVENMLLSETVVTKNNLIDFLLSSKNYTEYRVLITPVNQCPTNDATYSPRRPVAQRIQEKIPDGVSKTSVCIIGVDSTGKSASPVRLDLVVDGSGAPVVESRPIVALSSVPAGKRIEAIKISSPLDLSDTSLSCASGYAYSEYDERGRPKFCSQYSTEFSSIMMSTNIWKNLSGRSPVVQGKQAALQGGITQLLCPDEAPFALAGFNLISGKFQLNCYRPDLKSDEGIFEGSMILVKATENGHFKCPNNGPISGFGIKENAIDPNAFKLDHIYCARDLKFLTDAPVSAQ